MKASYEFTENGVVLTYANGETRLHNHAPGHSLISDVTINDDDYNGGQFTVHYSCDKEDCRCVGGWEEDF